MLVIYIKPTILIIPVILQDCVNVGIEDHVGQDKCAAITQTVDALSDELMHAGWMAYIHRTYQD
jgi:hypothetical protein